MLTLNNVTPLLLKEKKSIGYKDSTLKHYLRAFEFFRSFLQEENIQDLREIQREHLEDYVFYIQKKRHYRTGEPLKSSSQAHLISPILQLFCLLHRDHKILSNPAEYVKLPRSVHYMPKDILSEEEMGLWLSSMGECFGIFGRAVGEMLYGTGLRVSELKQLKCEDVNLADHMLFIREAKGGKDRVVPVPEKTMKVLLKYNRGAGEREFFFQRGDSRGVSISWIQKMCSVAAVKAGLEKRVSPHIIRHSFATHLLQRGMDIRFIQELLGHEEIMTTEIYVRVRDEDLKRVYLKSHPRA